jgi:hypothetical protein
MLALAPLAARAQDRNEAALWIVSQAHVPLGERLSFNVMVQNRLAQDIRVYDRTLVRPWLGVRLPEGFVLALGYDAHIIENPLELVEHRAWQRISYGHDFGRVRAFSHFWLEQRIREGVSRVGLVGRLLIGAQIAIPWEMNLVARDEIFFNMNTTAFIPRTGLNENRFFVGVNRPFGPHLRLEGGYQIQSLDRPLGDLFNHTLFIGVSVDTPQAFDLF